jgi:hypothetical protein
LGERATERERPGRVEAGRLYHMGVLAEATERTKRALLEIYVMRCTITYNEPSWHKLRLRAGTAVGERSCDGKSGYCIGA